MLSKVPPFVQRVEPSFIEPMQVAPVRQLPDGGKWTYEAKLDGYRCLVARRKGPVALWSRRGTIFTARFPQIARACEKLPQDTLVDGEVIVVGEDGRCSFNALQQSKPKGHVQFYAFDILIHRGRNVLKLPIEERRKLLTEALFKVQGEIMGSDFYVSTFLLHVKASGQASVGATADSLANLSPTA